MMHLISQPTSGLRAILILGLLSATFPDRAEGDQDPDNDAPGILIETTVIDIPAGLKAQLVPPSPEGFISKQQFDDLLEKQGFDRLTMRRVTAQSGKSATAAMLNEFAYTHANGQPAKKDLGITLHATPTVLEKNGVNLDFSVQILELADTTRDGNDELKPIFRERKESASVAMRFGQIAVLSFPPLRSTSSSTLTETTGCECQEVTTTNITKTENRQTLVLVGARLVD